MMVAILISFQVLGPTKPVRAAVTSRPYCGNGDFPVKYRHREGTFQEHQLHCRYYDGADAVYPFIEQGPCRKFDQNVSKIGSSALHRFCIGDSQRQRTFPRVSRSASSRLTHRARSYHLLPACRTLGTKPRSTSSRIQTSSPSSWTMRCMSPAAMSAPVVTSFAENWSDGMGRPWTRAEVRERHPHYARRRWFVTQNDIWTDAVLFLRAVYKEMAPNDWERLCLDESKVAFGTPNKPDIIPLAALMEASGLSTLNRECACCFS